MKLYWSLKKRLYRLFRPRYQVVRRHGVNLLLDSRNWIDTRLLIGQPYEDQQIASCANLIRENEISAFLDVGANIGLYSVFVSHLAPSAEVHAFEPVTRNYHQLCANLLINGLSGRVQPHCIALSDRDERAIIHIDPSSTGVSRMSLEDGSRSADVFTQQEQIQGRRLDNLLSWEDHRIFIKIDVEGHELSALRGMTRLLADNQVILQVEAFAGKPAEDLQEFMTSIGYQPLPNPGGDYRFSNFLEEKSGL